MRSIGNSLKSGQAAGPTGVFVVVFTPLSCPGSQVLHVQAAHETWQAVFWRRGEVFTAGERERGMDRWEGLGEREHGSSGQDSGTALLPKQGLLLGHSFRSFSSPRQPFSLELLGSVFFFDATNKLPYSSNKIRK